MNQPESHRGKVTGFLAYPPSVVHASIFLARRIQPFLSLVDCEVESCVSVLHLLYVWSHIGIYFFYFLVWKIGIEV